MASLLGNTSARRSSDSQRSFAGVPSSRASSRLTGPANRLPNCVIMLGFLVEGRGDAVGVLRQCGRRRFDVVEARAVVPEDLAADLIAERQAEKLLHRLGKRAVGMRIVGRDHEKVGAHFIDDVDRRLLVDIERDVALALEVLAGQHRQLMLAARAELLPLVIEPPEPPVEPSGGAFEEGAAEPRVTLEDAAG